VLLLSTTGLKTLYDHPDPDTGAEVHEGLGRLLTPRHFCSAQETAVRGIAWACDNDGYNGVDEDAFLKMIGKVENVPGCRFVCVPDVIRCGGYIDRATKQHVAGCGRTMDGYGGAGACHCEVSELRIGDARLTRQRFDEWQPLLAQTGLPLALVLQDGQEDVDVPWEQIAAVFVGGSTEFKEGAIARAICLEAKARGKWVHFGRVNSKRRMAIALAGGADSVDGTKFVRWRKTHLNTGLRWARELVAQQSLAVAA
jgi:hypothetical protein